MKRSMMFLAAAILALAACDEKKTEPAAEDPAGKNATTTGATETAAQPVTINDSDLATPADFEDTAEQSINKDNYKDELAKLEKDIDQP